MKRRWLLFSLTTLIFLGGLFIRLYRLDSLMNFSMEQTWALFLTGDMVNNQKLALIGTPYISRETASHHYFFQAATYLYPIAPLYLIFHGDPLPITAVFAIVNILSGLALYFITKKFFGPLAAIFTFFLFSFNFVLVDYSRLIWHVPMLIPIVTALVYLFFSHLRQFKPINSLWIGFVVGLGWGIHVSLTVIGALLFVYFCLQAIQKRNLFLVPLYVAGGLTGILPLIIFDIRHNYFNLRILWEFFLGLFNQTNKYPFIFTSYHLVHLIPLGCLLFGWLLSNLYRYQRLITILLLIAYLLFNAPLWRLNADTPLGLPEKWNLAGMKKASAIIAADTTSEFTVAQIIEGETRASTIRYLLEHLHNQRPLSDTDYLRADILYLIARTDQDILNYRVWELDVLRPYVVSQSWPLQADITLFQLSRL